MRKKIIWNISAGLFIFLVLCTFAAIQVEKLVLPQVEASEAVPGTVIVDGAETAYDYTIPISALELCGEDYFVYCLQEWDGQFGKELSVMRVRIGVIAQDGVTAALSSPGYGRMVVRTNKPLEDGSQVILQSRAAL